MEKELKRILEDEKIEYYASVPFASLSVTKPHLVERLDFTPRSALIFLVPYYFGECGNISRYAASRDYHIFLKSVGEKLGGAIADGACASYAVFGDHSPIDERAAAELAGLGKVGENGLLINEKYGTYLFIGEVLTDIDLSEYMTKREYGVPECYRCGKCAAACPKERIGVCLSALTQKKGTLTSSEQAAIKEYGVVWGCDLCQSACPHNEAPALTPIPFFREKRIPTLDLSILEGMSDQDFAERAYSWRTRETVVRNLLLLNTGACEENGEKCKL